ncbi:MAG: DUF4350 domain-containing protein, partial [Pseudomonadota bacterium]
MSGRPAETETGAGAGAGVSAGAGTVAGGPRPSRTAGLTGKLLPILVGALLLAFALVPSAPEDDTGSSPTTFSPGPHGCKALYLLMQELGLDARRLQQADEYDYLGDDEILWILPAAATLSRLERQNLVEFVDAGGTVVAPAEATALLMEEAGLGQPELRREPSSVRASWDTALEVDTPPESLDGVPPPDRVFASADHDVPIVAAWYVGDGQIVLLGIAGIAENNQIGKAQNGAFLVRLASELGSSHVF